MESRLQFAVRRAFELQLDLDEPFIPLVEMRLPRNARAGNHRLGMQGLFELARVIRAADKWHECRYHYRSSHKHSIHAASSVIQQSEHAAPPIESGAKIFSQWHLARNHSDTDLYPDLLCRASTVQQPNKPGEPDQPVSSEPAAYPANSFGSQRSNIGERVPDLVVRECFPPGSHRGIRPAIMDTLKESCIQLSLDCRGCEIGDRRSKLHLPVSLTINPMAAKAGRRIDDLTADHIRLRLRHV